MCETKRLYSGVNTKHVRSFLPVIVLGALFISVVHSEAQDRARNLSEISIEELLQLDLEQINELRGDYADQVADAPV